MDMPHSDLITEHLLTIFSYVPADFSVPVVSVDWKKTWAASWATLSSLSLDFRNPRLRDGDDETKRLRHLLVLGHVISNALVGGPHPAAGLGHAVHLWVVKVVGRRAVVAPRLLLARER